MRHGAKRTIALLAFATLASAQTAADRGASLLRAGHFDDAIVAFAEAERQQPPNAQLQNLIGITLTQLDRIEEANQHYRTAIRLSPTLEVPHKNLGFNLLGAKRYAEAESELKTSLLLDPADSYNHYYLGLVYLATGKKELAVKHLLQSQSQLAKDSDTALAFIRLCLESGRKNDADQLISKFVSDQALTTKQAYAWATGLTLQHAFPEAVTLFQYVAKDQPDAWVNHYNLAIALLDDKRQAEAIPVLTALTTAQSENADLYGLLGAALEIDNKPSDALSAYARALQLEPANPDRYLEYSRLLIELDRFDDSSNLIEEGIARVSDSYGLLMRLGSVSMVTGKFADARSAFSQAVQQHPEISLGYIGIARTYLLEGKAEQAISILTAARKDVQPDFLLQYFEGLALERSNKPQAGLEAFRKAVALSPNVPEVHYEEGKLYLKLSDFTSAREEFEKTIKLDPKHARAFYQLSLVCQRQGDPQKAHQFAAVSRALMSSNHHAAIDRLGEKLQQSELKSFP